jgi:hypothetical protein
LLDCLESSEGVLAQALEYRLGFVRIELLRVVKKGRKYTVKEEEEPTCFANLSIEKACLEQDLPKRVVI